MIQHFSAVKLVRKITSALFCVTATFFLLSCNGNNSTLTTPDTDAAGAASPAPTTANDNVLDSTPLGVTPTLAPPTATTEIVPTAVIPTDTPVPTVPSEVINEAPQAQLPPGFSLVKFADYDRPTGLAFDAEGRLFATSNGGQVHILPDSDQDGRADFVGEFSFGFNVPNGIWVDARNNDVYVSSMGSITILRDTDGDLVADQVVPFVQNLPAGRHQNNNMQLGPDGWLYVGVGSTCDACIEPDARSATIMRFDLATAQGEVFASGLRNAYDIAFHPETGAMFATENGRDDLGPGEPFEELNHIIQNGNYGFPDCWNQSVGPGCTGTIVASAFFQARSSTNSLSFVDNSNWPDAYQGELLATVFGSFEADVARGIHQITISPSGSTYTGEVDWFIRWPDSWLLGMTFGPDGALYVGDYINGGIYRISYGAP